MQNGFVWGNQIIPILDNQFLPVLGTAAIPSDILMEEMRDGDELNKRLARLLADLLDSLLWIRPDPDPGVEH